MDIEGDFIVIPSGREAELDAAMPPPPEAGEGAQLVIEAPLGGSMEDAFKRQRVILPEGATRASTVQHLLRQVPRNEFGLSTHYIRSDMLPYDLETLTQGDVDAAVIKLDFSEGYPTTEKGRLFWSKLEHEPEEAFYIFKAYLDQAEMEGIRQLELLSHEQGVELAMCQQWHLEYMWSLRSKAFDLFQAAADRKRREYRIRSTENTHYSTAGRLLEHLDAAFMDPEWVNNLSPMEAIEALEKLMKIQRLSLGLTGQQASSLSHPASQGSVEVIMRSLNAAGGGSSQGADFAQDLSALMADPDFGMKAQELIIRATRSVTPTTTNDQATFG